MESDVPEEGLTFARSLAPQLNNTQMAEWIKRYPKALGAFACLPPPDVQEAIEEAKVGSRSIDQDFACFRGLS